MLPSPESEARLRISVLSRPYGSLAYGPALAHHPFQMASSKASGFSVPSSAIQATGLDSYRGLHPLFMASLSLDAHFSKLILVADQKHFLLFSMIAKSGCLLNVPSRLQVNRWLGSRDAATASPRGHRSNTSSSVVHDHIRSMSLAAFSSPRQRTINKSNAERDESGARAALSI